MKHLNIALSDEDYERLNEVKKGYGLNWHDLLMSVTRNISFNKAEDVDPPVAPATEPAQLEDQRPVIDRPVKTRTLKARPAPLGISETACPKCGADLDDDWMPPDDEHEAEHKVRICYVCGYQRDAS